MMREALVNGDVKFKAIYSSLFNVISTLANRIDKAAANPVDDECKKELNSISVDLKKLIDFHEFGG